MSDWPSLDSIQTTAEGERADVEGVVTVEEIWNEIGAPPDTPQARSHTPKRVIEATRNRVLRGYDAQALSAVQQREGLGPFRRFARVVTLPVSADGGVGRADIPEDLFPLIIRALAPDNTPLAPATDVGRLAATSLTWTDYRYERNGRNVLVLPPDVGEMDAHLVPQDLAVTATLRNALPDINQEIISACREALEARTQQAQRIEQEAAGETPQ